jgi:hypothetical protein
MRKQRVLWIKVTKYYFRNWGNSQYPFCSLRLWNDQRTYDATWIGKHSVLGQRLLRFFGEKK